MESGKKGFPGGRSSTCRYVKVGALQEAGVPWDEVGCSVERAKGGMPWLVHLYRALSDLVSDPFFFLPSVVLLRLKSKVSSCWANNSYNTA